MNQDDQRFVLMAAAAQAHYAKEQARREARKAALLSQVSALSNSSQPMDPKLQAELERLIRAEAQRTEQENFDWACGKQMPLAASRSLPHDITSSSRTVHQTRTC